MRRACVVLLAVLLAREAVADVLVRVVDEAGLPLASTEVQEFGSSDSPARTDAEGRCTLPRETPLNLCVSAFGRASRFVQVEAGQVEVRVELATGGALSGFVRDSEGRPVPRVTLLEASGSPCERSTMTDEQGRYDFLSRAPGLQRIALAGADILTPPEQRLRLAPAESRQLDFVVHRIGYLILLLKNPDGSACTDQAELRLASQWHSLAFDPPLTSHQLAEIGARKSQALVDGRLELAALPLHAEWPVAIHVEGRPLLTVRVPLLESTAEHDVVVPFGGVLSGRLVTAEGKPWPHPRVVLLHLDARKMGLLPDSLPSGDEEGRIEVRGLPAGTWDFELTAPGARPRILRDVPIQPGQTSSFGDLALERGVSIEGRVTDDRGLPIPDASVLALPQIVGRPYLGRSVITNADGRFVHDGLEPGTRLELMVYATGHLMWGPQDVFAPAQDVSCVVQRAAAVRVRAHDAGSGEPLRQLRVIGWFGVPAALSMDFEDDENGIATIDDLQPGPWRFTVISPGRLPAQGEVVQLGAGEPPKELDLALEAGASLAGRVEEQGSARPVPGARIEAHADRALLSTTHAGADGSFVIEGLPARVELLVTEQAHQSLQRQVDVANHREPLVLVLSPR